MKKTIFIAILFLSLLLAVGCETGPYDCKCDCGKECSDADGDGFYNLRGCGTSVDCDDGDSAVYPGARELCDGHDNQCPGDDGYGEIDEARECALDNMALVPSGCFDMGDHFNEGIADELPVHSVCITYDFYMDKHEATNAEYAACVNDGECTLPNSLGSWTRTDYYGNPDYDDFPVLFVNWYQAAAYCAWAEKRLPTEAEWEYAGRGGLDGYRYPHGNLLICSDACYGRLTSAGYCWDFNGLENDTHRVESYRPNGYGLYDMTGNVFEWTAEWYSDAYYQYCVDNDIVNDPPGPSTGAARVVRGGYWYGNLINTRVSFRHYYNPISRSRSLGFRCAAD